MGRGADRRNCAESDELVIEASVSPIDIDGCLKGEARIRFSTFGNNAPTIKGTLFGCQQTLSR